MSWLPSFSAASSIRFGQRLQRALPSSQMLMHRLFPGVCDLCLQHNQRGRDLCQHCHQALPWNIFACPRCAEPLPYSKAECRRCPKDWVIQQTLAPLLYQGPAKYWVQALKFRQNLVAGRLLGELLADSASLAYQSPGDLPTKIVPIPLHWRRLIRRGLNQAQVIGKPCARRLSIDMQVGRLKRRFHQASQRQLKRAQRLVQVTNSYHSKNWHGEHIALIDDVITTGATANAAARACMEAGASRVDLWCATRTPAPEPQVD